MLPEVGRLQVDMEGRVCRHGREREEGGFIPVNLAIGSKKMSVDP